MRKPGVARVLWLSVLLASLTSQAVAAPREGNAESRFCFHGEIDLYLGLKAGVEYSLSEFWGLRGAAGFCLISPLQASYAIVGVRHFFPPENPFQLDVHVGLIQGILNLLEPAVDLDPAVDSGYAYWVPGICASIGYGGRSGNVFSFRLGGGMLFGYDMGQWQKPALHLNAALEYRRRNRR